MRKAAGEAMDGLAERGKLNEPLGTASLRRAVGGRNLQGN